jgi:hypothetical protein
MTPADRRITELIDKWLVSVDLHLKYVELSDAAYSRAQPWPKHDRPTRWVLEVARQKLLELKGHVEARQAMGDAKFSESLELMSFLANLVGIQHIQRFVPLADPSLHDTGTGTTTTQATIEATVIQPHAALPPRPRAPAPVEEATREMPKVKPGPRLPARPASEREPVRESMAPAAIPTPRASAKPQAKGGAGQKAPAKAAAAPRAAAATDMKGKILADAVRLLKWGKSWHELPELIERIAERPPASDIRKLLRTHRDSIEAQAGEDG